ncbi:MAG TPA: ROK family protein [Chitinophagaceae bacterium]|nr:ROK family protein [Chitinophagaceae bacterium]
MITKTSYFKRKIIKELCFGNVLSAQQISVLVNRSLPVTIKLLSELVHEGMIIESGFALSTGGRRPQMYSLAAGKIHIISVAMDQVFTTLAVIDAQHHQISHARKCYLNLFENPNNLTGLIRCLEDFIKEASIEKDKIIGIGIGMPGFVDVSKGINYSFLDNDGKSIPDNIEQLIGIPVFIDNDSSLIALAESKFGAAKGKKNAMVINFGWGIGLGMILNYQLFRGNNGFAGEFSHVHLFDNNKLCECGKSGCLETEASLMVVIEKVKQALKEGKVSAIKHISDDFEEALSTVIRAALKGDQLAVDLLSEVAYNIGRGIAILIHILNPELIVISGRGATAGNMLLAPMQQAINKYCIPRLASYTQITVSPFSANAELIGGAALVIENYEKNIYQSVKNNAA